MELQTARLIKLSIDSNACDIFVKGFASVLGLYSDQCNMFFFSASKFLCTSC